MTTVDVEQRAAILLNALGKETVEAVLAQLSPDGEKRLRGRLQNISDEPPDHEVIVDIIEEFDRVLQFALDAINEELQDDVTVDGFGQTAAGDATDKTTAPFVPSEDAISDLKQLQAFQIAGGLQGESPRTIAIVLDCLDPEQASETIGYLTGDTRSEVFIHLNNPPSTSPMLLNRILRTTIDKGLGVKRDALDASRAQKEQKLAGILRSMDRKARNQIIDKLEESNAELVDRLRELLYEFSDICNIEDRSLQKLLGEIETKTLCTALSGADQEILNKVTSNLSKRARESLLEEMSLMGSVPDEERESAVKEIVDAMQRLDQAGELVML